MLLGVLRDQFWERDGSLLLVDPRAAKVGNFSAALSRQDEQLADRPIWDTARWWYEDAPARVSQTT